VLAALPASRAARAPIELNRNRNAGNESIGVARQMLTELGALEVSGGSFGGATIVGGREWSRSLASWLLDDCEQQQRQWQVADRRLRLSTPRDTHGHGSVRESGRSNARERAHEPRDGIELVGCCAASQASERLVDRGLVAVRQQRCSSSVVRVSEWLHSCRKVRRASNGIECDRID